MHNIFGRFSTIIYVLATMTMGVTALGLVGSSILKIYYALTHFPINQSILLDAVSLVVISIAIFDVAKYIMEEEILRDRELREPKEAREAITKFMVIIALVVALEGIVFIFDLGKEQPEYLIYPVLLLFISVIMVVGLGIYQRLSLNAEKDLAKSKEHLSRSKEHLSRARKNKETAKKTDK